MEYHNYYVYMTTNPKRKVLYIGVTNDLGRRMDEHYEDNIGPRKTFAGKYFCYNLVYYEYFRSIEEAIGREKYLKGLIRKKKNTLIEFFNPQWRFLNCKAEQAKGNLPVWTLDMEDDKPW